MTRLSITILGAAASILLAGAAAGSPSQRFVATVASPATVPLLLSSDRTATTASDRFVDVAVQRFRPSPAGPVQIVVTAVTAGIHTEIGRFGIYPERAFAQSGAQHFRLAVPGGLRLTASTRLSVRIVPSRGDGSQALVELSAGRLHNQ